MCCPFGSSTTAGSPRNNRHAEAVSLLSSWLRANHFNTNKEHISERISDSHIVYVYIYIYIYIYIEERVYMYAMHRV